MNFWRDFSRNWRWFCIITTVWLAGWVAVVSLMTMHWKLVSDPAQVQFSVSLVDAGMAPYRDIIDNQMPGTYMVYSAIMHTVGSGDVAWRLFDLALLVVASLAIFAITRPYGWFAGVFASALFCLLHLHGGDEQMGQRDLIIAILLLVAYSLLYFGMRHARRWPIFFVGFCGALAGMIKPTALVFTLALLGAAGLWLRERHERLAPALALGAAGMAVPVAMVFAYLRAHGSLGWFVYTIRVIVPFYARMGRVGIWDMLRNSKTIPMLAIFLALAIAVGVLHSRRRADAGPGVQEKWEMRLLIFGMLFGLAHYFVQGRGFPYHRYPFFAFALVWMSIQFVPGVREQGTASKLAFAGLMMGVVVAPLLSRHALGTPAWGKDYRESLASDLEGLGGRALSGHIQCMAAAGDCDIVLLRMHLVQATGLMYDFLVLGDGAQPVMRDLRAREWSALQRNPPEVIVLSPFLFPEQPCDHARPLAGVGFTGAETGPNPYDFDKYAKVKTWPQFDQWLASGYTIVRDHSEDVKNAPCKFTMGYRIYKRH